MPIVEYGSIKTDVSWRWPTKETFKSWKQDIFSLEESKDYDFYLVGGFNDTLFREKTNNTSDIDVIIIGEKNVKKIEKLIYEGTKLGLEKYQTFFDILWFDKLPIYSQMKVGEAKKVKMCLLGNKWKVDGRVIKSCPDAIQLSENLWQMEKTFPTQKQSQRIKNGYNYLSPHKILLTGQAR